MGYIGRGQEVEGRTQEARFGGQDMGLGKGGRIWRGRIGEGSIFVLYFSKKFQEY
jgi:hypothetical protein